MSASNEQQAGWSSWGPARYIPGYGDYWQQPGVVGNLNSVADKAKEVLDNPHDFARDFVAGAMEGATGRAPEGEEVEAGEDPPSLYNRVKKLVEQGVSKAAVVALEKLLENASGDEELKAQALQQLRDGRQDEVWETLNSRHIVWGGVNLNAKKCSNEMLRKDRLNAELEDGFPAARLHEVDSKSPINSLIRCQEIYRDLRQDHRLPPIVQPETRAASAIPSSVVEAAPEPVEEEERESIEELQQGTNEAIDQFCDRTVHFSTMYAMRSIFSHNIEPTEFNRLIQHGGDLQSRYLDEAGGGRFKQFIYRHTYSVIVKFISTLIRETIEGVTGHVREFLKDDISMLKFAEEKIKDLSNYYGRIERGRKQYFQPINPDDPGSEAGSFDEFITMTILKYGTQRLTEEELIKQFGDFIVSNYTPRPNIEIQGHRIPLISTFLEWSVHSIQKGLIRFFLRRTQLVNSILTQGTGSVQTAQLGLKTMLLNKLTEIVDMVQRSRPRAVTELPEEGDQTRVQLEAQKARLITRNLHKVIKQHSSNLHRFIAIEKCNNKDAELRDLDNRVEAMVHEILHETESQLQVKVPTVQGVLEDATTNLLETALLSLFDNKERQIESQMQGIFEVLEKTYDYTDPAQRWAIEQQQRQELSQVEANISEQLGQLSRLAVEAALEDHLKNASTERHRKIVKFVEQEKEEMQRFGEFLTEQKESLDQLIVTYNDEELDIAPVKRQLNEIISNCEAFLGRTSTILRSDALTEDCYQDVRGDLYNGYGLMVKQLQRFACTTLDPMLNFVEQIEEKEKRLQDYTKAMAQLEQLPTDHLSTEIAKELATVNLLFPDGARIQVAEKTEQIRQKWVELDPVNHQLRLFEELHKLETEEENIRGKIERLNTVQKEITELSNWVRELHDLRGPNRAYRTQESVNERRNVLRRSATRCYRALMSYEDPDVQQYVLHLLRSGNSEELYKKLHPSMRLQRAVPIFSACAHTLQFLEEKDRKNRELKTDLQRQTEELDEDELQARKEGLVDQINVCTRTAVSQIEELGHQMLEELNEDLKSLSGLLPTFKTTGAAIDTVGNEFHVSSCLAVGELTFMQNLLPIATTIAPQIAQSITSLLDSLGKPFHYKQLILRLIFLDVVNRENM